MGTLLTALIRNGDLPGIIQKISAYYVIYDLFKGDGQNETPFLTVFLYVIEQKELISKVNVIEKNFVAQLLSAGGTKEVRKLKLFESVKLKRVVHFSWRSKLPGKF